MSRSLYNPFMPSVHFRDRAVFGGGDSNGTTPLGFNEGGTAEDAQKAKDAGKIRLEGKEYEVQDGDIMNFRFNN